MWTKMLRSTGTWPFINLWKICQPKANTSADILLDIWERTGKYHHNHACRVRNVFPTDSFMYKFVKAMNKEPLEANKITIMTDEQQCAKIRKSKI
jgi:hypothetical protein